ncbi:hypothetical protein [Streptomyces sp. NPDC006658]|uniref:hypothetical protein n=1 Tax=Streptomyces sp. NPDC006658 TaxID=3156900 RepID=UPI0033FB4114
MRTIRVETSGATILLTEAPEPKVRDRQTGEIAKDANSGEALPLPQHSPRSDNGRNDQHLKAAHGDDGAPGLVQPPPSPNTREPKYQRGRTESGQPPRLL